MTPEIPGDASRMSNLCILIKLELNRKAVIGGKQFSVPVLSDTAAEASGSGTFALIPESWGIRAEFFWIVMSTVILLHDFV